MPQASIGWDDATVEKLKRLWERGDTASQIARQLGITRNTVIGKVFRLQLPARLASNVKKDRLVLPPPKRWLKQHAKQMSAASQRGWANKDRAKRGQGASYLIRPEARRPLPADVGPLERANAMPDGATAHKPLLDLGPHDCRWPIGDSPYVFCAQPKGPIGSYCPFHMALSTPAAEQPRASVKAA
jgi:GcrA cell cycle regulator